MYISYEYYRIFYHVARCGNLTKAAEALQNSQPNLTRAIRNLEAEIGCPLFSRTNRGMILTPEGEGLYRHIKIACTEIEAGEAAVTQSRTLERGNVFLAASEGALRCLLLPVLKRYQEKYPGVHLRISNHCFQLIDSHLKHALSLFSRIVFRIFRQVTLIARFGYSSRNLRALYCFQLFQFCHQFFVTIF